MNPRLPASRQISVRVSTVNFDGLLAMGCPSCGAGLDLSQPDANLPDRFLATCTDCGGWFVVEPTPDTGQARIVDLAPIINALHRSAVGRRASSG